MDTNCAPLIADLFLHAYETDCLQWISTGTHMSASYLDIYREFDSNCQERKKKTLDDKCDDFNFPMINFTFISSNISGTPTYGITFNNLYVILGIVQIIVNIYIACI